MLPLYTRLIKMNHLNITLFVCGSFVKGSTHLPLLLLLRIHFTCCCCCLFLLLGLSWFEFISLLYLLDVIQLMIDALPYHMYICVFVYHILYIHEQQQINNSSESNWKKKYRKIYISQLGLQRAHNSSKCKRGNNNCADEDVEKSAKQSKWSAQ